MSYEPLPIPFTSHASNASLAPTEYASSAEPSTSRSPPLAGPAVKPKKTRTRNGCLTCRARKKRCDEQRPACTGCSRLALECEWEDAERSAIERRERREQRKREKVENKQRGPVPRKERSVSGAAQLQELGGLDALATAGLMSSMAERGPTSGPERVSYSPHDHPLPLPSPPTQLMPHPAWTGYLDPAASVPALGPIDPGWTTSFLHLIAPPSTQYSQYEHDQIGHDTAQPRTGDKPRATPQISDVDISSWLDQTDLAHTFAPLARSRPHSPAQPFESDLSALFPPFGDFNVLNLPPNSPHGAQNLSTSPAAMQVMSLNSRPDACATTRDSTVSQAASFVASADFAFTQAYLLSHYTTILAKHVSIASSATATSVYDRAPSDGGSSSSSSSRNAASTSTSANLFLSLIPHAHQKPFLMHSILSWSSANLAAASSSSSTTDYSSSSDKETSAMANLSDELGSLAETLLAEVISGLNDSQALPQNGRQVEFEPVLAAVLMLCQASICRGDVNKWRERLKQAAHVVNLVGGLSACRSPLARQLVRNLLYHDVLSSSSSKHGLLLDYSSLRPSGAHKTSSNASKQPASGLVRGDRGGTSEEEAGDEVLDTLMGLAEPVFLLIGKITSLAREKHEASRKSSGMIAEEQLGALLAKLDEVRAELEHEKERVDDFVSERPDLEPHRYFHEVFRLAALLYLHMVSELPPRSYPVVYIIRKMLSLFEMIVDDKLPGLCSCHFALYVMHLNSTSLTSPHSQLDDRQRSTKVFDYHMEAFTFLNTNRSRKLIDEAWRRSRDGRIYVDPDAILEEWGWDLNFA
ncbi:Zn(II)2Cys6 transcription factor [Sporobolomyces koalae]|uniref:Zn(II)2Cys6 transcription factor n=1 Tax=Sporobolomyces koalae TaxID=500713 RepID=UPI00317623F3